MIKPRYCLGLEIPPIRGHVKEPIMSPSNELGEIHDFSGKMCILGVAKMKNFGGEFRSQEIIPIGLQGSLVSITFNQSARVEFGTHLM